MWLASFFALLILLITSALPLSRAGAAIAEPSLRETVLGAGRSTEWRTPPGAQVSVSNGGVVRVSDKGATLKITGKKNGVATIKAGPAQLDVIVLSEAKYALYQALSKALVGKRGLELKVDSGEISVRGRLLRWSDWADLGAVAQSSNQRYRFRAIVEPSALNDARLAFKRLLQQSGLPDLLVELDGGALVVLPAEPAELKTRAERALDAYGVAVETGPSSLTLEPLVRVKIVVAEIRKSLMNRLGVTWPGSIEGQLLPSLNVPSDPGLSVGINALEQQGLGRVLASPVLLCRSGKEAHFLAGGEFPIRIASKQRQDVVWKRYGVLLNIKPRADFAGRMSIAVETEVSMIDPSQTVDGVPGLLSNRIETHFDLTGSRTIALSGLIKEEWSKSTEGLPGLASLPVLGTLFGSREYRDNKTELMVFVTPEVVRPDVAQDQASSTMGTENEK